MIQKQGTDLKTLAKTNSKIIKTLVKNERYLFGKPGDRLNEDSASCSTKDSPNFDELYDSSGCQNSEVDMCEKEMKIIEYLENNNIRITSPTDKIDLFYEENRRRLWQKAFVLKRQHDETYKSFSTPHSNEVQSEDSSRSSFLLLNLSDSKFIKRHKEVLLKSAGRHQLKCRECSIENGNPVNFKSSRFLLSKLCSQEASKQVVDYNSSKGLTEELVE